MTWWTMCDIAEASGARYNTVQSWVRKQRIPTYKFPGDPVLRIHPNDAADVVAMARITTHRLDGWGSLPDVLERYSVTRQTVSRWVRDGTILKVDTYGRPIYSVDSVVGDGDQEARQKAWAHAQRWEGFRQKHPRVWVKDEEAA